MEENELTNVIMICSLLDETTEEFEMLEKNFGYFINAILDDCYGNLFTDEDEEILCERRKLLEIINIPIIDVLKNPPDEFKYIWDNEINNIVHFNFGEKHEKLGKWFNKYFTYWEDLEGEKLEQYNTIYQKQLDHYLNKQWTNGWGNMDHVNRVEQERQQYLKQR